jgi:transposase-like protein
MPRVPAHLRGMLQGGMRTADVARAIKCNVRSVRRRRQRYRETGRTADGPRSGRPRVTTPAQTTCNNTRIGTCEHHTCGTGTGWQQQLPELHQESTIPPSVLRLNRLNNRLREAGLGACRPVVRQVLTRHHRKQRRLWAQTHRRWTRQDWQKLFFTDESRFCLTRGDGRICVYCQKNERYRGLYSGA